MPVPDAIERGQHLVELVFDAGRVVLPVQLNGTPQNDALMQSLQQLIREIEQRIGVRCSAASLALHATQNRVCRGECLDAIVVLRLARGGRVFLALPQVLQRILIKLIPGERLTVPTSLPLPPIEVLQQEFLELRGEHGITGAYRKLGTKRLRSWQRIRDILNGYDAPL